MTIYIQCVLNGLCSGAVYGLIALSLSLLFGVMKIINFAHGSMLMISMFLTLWASKFLGVHPLVAIVMVMPVMFVIGYLVQRLLIQSIYEKETAREPIGVLIFTTGLWIFFDNLFLMIQGPDYQVIKDAWVDKAMILGDIFLSYAQIAGLLISTLIALLSILFLTKTKLGSAIRATGQDRVAASVLGINSLYIYNVSFGLAMATLGASGALLVPQYYVYPAVGDIFGLRAFVIVVLGGMGSIGGAFIGGIIVGLIESLASQFVPATFVEAIIFALFLIILYFRPAGLFGLESE
jgi:branched-chain amino acid transport system permease protein